MRTLHPLVYVQNPPEAKEQVYNWFLPGVDALVAMARERRLRRGGIDRSEERPGCDCLSKSKGNETPPALKHFVAKLELKEAPRTGRASAELTFRFQVENIGLTRWPAFGDEGTDKGAVQLGSHLLMESEEEVDWDYGRARLPRDLEPGGTADLTRVRLPETAEDTLWNSIWSRNMSPGLKTTVPGPCVMR